MNFGLIGKRLSHSFSKDFFTQKFKQLNNKNHSYENYEIDKYCPHQQYDLSHHGKVDLEKCTIQCLGHGWKWKLDTGKGINCNLDIETKKI